MLNYTVYAFRFLRADGSIGCYVGSTAHLGNRMRCHRQSRRGAILIVPPIVLETGIRTREEAERLESAYAEALARRIGDVEYGI